MKSLFDPEVLEQTVARVEQLSASASRQWGTMSPAQMLEHSARALDMACGGGPQRQALVGKLMAWVVRKEFFGEKPFSKNAPTGPDFVVREEPEFASAKARLVAQIRRFHALGEVGCNGHVHSFFGRLTGVEWGITQYKHLDHHLRQFGV